MSLNLQSAKHQEKAGHVFIVLNISRYVAYYNFANHFNFLTVLVIKQIFTCWL